VSSPWGFFSPAKRRHRRKKFNKPPGIALNFAPQKGEKKKKGSVAIGKEGAHFAQKRKGRSSTESPRPAGGGGGGGGGGGWEGRVLFFRFVGEGVCGGFFWGGVLEVVWGGGLVLCFVVWLGVGWGRGGGVCVAGLV